MTSELDSPLGRFLSIRAELETERGWFSDVATLRFAALAVLRCEGAPHEIAARIRETAAALKRRAGWFSELQSAVRFVIAAALVADGDTAQGFLWELGHASHLFRQERIRRGGFLETIAILILRQRSPERRIGRELVRRFHAVYEEMKRHHWWLTGTDDFPACALLACEEGTPGAIVWRAERAYRAVRRLGIAPGEALQTTANLLPLSGADPDSAAERFVHLAEGFRSAGVSIWRSDYDELAVLSLLDLPTSRVVDRVLDVRRALRELRPRPDASSSFNLAVGIAFVELAEESPRVARVTRAKALVDLHVALQAQTAAFVAVGVAASSAATSS